MDEREKKIYEKVQAEARAHARHHAERCAMWYDINRILGNDWAMFFVLIGARETGKSFSVMEFCLRQWVNKKTPFTWIRLSSVSRDKMLLNSGAKFIDPDLVRKYNLDLKVKGMDVFDRTRDPDCKRPMAKVLALSEMAKEKGVALYDGEYDGWYNIVCDEFMLEKNEVRRFDVSYNLVNTLENLVRSRKQKVRIFLICNMLEEANGILVDGFRFIPEDFGVYKLKSKRAVIEYMRPSAKYIERRKGTVADLLTPEASNFTNKIERDKTLIYTGKLTRPQVLIKFGKSKNDWYVLWDDRIIKMYNKEQGLPSIAMRPYIDDVFYPDRRDQILLRYDTRLFYYPNMLTQKAFEKELQDLRPKR